MRSFSKFLAFVVLVLGLWTPSVGRTAVLDVDRTDDDAAATACSAAANDCSLRGAIITANGNGETDTINLQSGATYTLSILSTCEDNAADGDLDITDDLTIVGNGSTVDGADIDRIFFISTNNGPIVVTISGLTIQNGTAQEDTGACGPGGFGGGILVSSGETLNLNNVTVTQNEAVAGGGISNDGTLSIQDSVISGNRATSTFSQEGGGGIFNDEEGTQTILRSTISGNTAISAGGGIMDFDTDADPAQRTTIIESTLSGNTADAGGGLYTDVGLDAGIITLINSTVSGNDAIFGDVLSDSGSGGGIFVCYGTVSLRNVTVTDNSAEEEGGGVALPSCGESQLILRNSIVAANQDLDATVANPDCILEDPSELVSEDFNLIGDETGCDGLFTGAADQVGTAATPVIPSLGLLANNGGPTQTHALLPGSPAIDTANPAGCFSNDTNDGGLLTTDQRGSPRPLDGDVAGPTPPVCDIGAFELGGCGDGFLDPAVEACDDGNTIDGDGCSAACLLESCGDGVIQAPEQCDDGNTLSGDGCSPACQIEPVPTPIPTPTPTATPIVLTQGGCLASLTGTPASGRLYPWVFGVMMVGGYALARRLKDRNQ